MSEIKFSPAQEVGMVADQNMLLPATNFTFSDFNTKIPVDMSVYDMELVVKEGISGGTVLSWSTADSTITVSGDDNEVVTLEEKTSEQMNFTAKTYYYEWTFTIPGSSPVRYFYGQFILRPTA